MEVLYVILGAIAFVLIVMRVVSARVYDVIIVHMTKLWYQVVLERLDKGTAVLDLGIGTATALLRNKSLVVDRDLTVVGVDYDQAYITAAIKAVEKQGLQERIKLHCKSIFDQDLPKVIALDGENGEKRDYDAVYFSGSWSLMPSPVEALRVAAGMCKKDGLIYVTQTFQKHPSPFMKRLKPMLKYFTTIDFGNLHLVADLDRYLLEAQEEKNGIKFKILEKKVIPGSIDNALQAAYLIVLQKVVTDSSAPAQATKTD